MNLLKPQPPFVWPEPRVCEKFCDYENSPSFGELAQTSSSLFGTVNGITSCGIELLETWLKGNPNLRANIIVIVYPACSTRKKDLMQMLALAEFFKDRLIVHIRPLATLTDRGTNALFFMKDASNDVHVVTGPTEDFGLAPVQEGQFNFVFRAEPSLVEAFKRYFDWLWANTRKITAKKVAWIPDLVIPEGTAEPFVSIIGETISFPEFSVDASRAEKEKMHEVGEKNIHDQYEENRWFPTGYQS